MDKVKFDQFCMEQAYKESNKSNDKHTKVGSVIVNKDGIKIGAGHNELLSDTLPSEKNDEWLDSKYPYTIHAEPSAILSVKDKESLIGGTLYVTLFPCNECMKLIIASGITRVVYDEDKYHDMEMSEAARRLAKACNIVLDQVTR